MCKTVNTLVPMTVHDRAAVIIFPADNHHWTDDVNSQTSNVKTHTHTHTKTENLLCKKSTTSVFRGQHIL